MSPGRRWLAPLLFALLAGATLATFALVENERDHPTIIIHDKVRPRPTRECPPELKSFMRVKFTITRGEQHADVVIVDESGQLVRTLASDVELIDDDSYEFRWNAKDEDGNPVGPGRYRMRIRLGDLDRDLPLPSTCVVGVQTGAVG